MRKINILLITLLIFTHKGFTQAPAGADAILGQWINTPHETLVIEVYRSGNSFEGRILRSADSIKKPVGFNILTGLSYNPKTGNWTDGKVRTPNGSRSYNATAKIKANGNLEVYGYAGIKMFGSRKNFRRIN